MGINFTRRHKPKALVDLVPMIDIVFQLVIFFMVATTFKTTSGIELELPRAKEVTEITETPLNISILSRNTIYINERKTTLEELPRLIGEYKSSHKSAIVYGSKAMEYQLLIDVMDILRVEGFDGIDLAIDKKVFP